MPPYPIEIINFGNPAFDIHTGVIDELNAVQNDIVYCLPPERNRLWGVPFERERYETQYIWERLRDYRATCKGFHPFILAIVQGYLGSPRLGNLFGSREEKEGLAVVTTYDWDSYFAPPPLAVYLMYYFIRYAMSFICPENESHEDTRNCFFDKKINKSDIKLSMVSGKICDECRSVLERRIDRHTYRSLISLVEHLKERAVGPGRGPVKKPKVFIGSSSEGLSVAEHLQLGLDSSAETTIWSQGVFGLSKGNLESLVAAVEEFDYSVLVLTPDDLTVKRGVSGNSPRDNVLFEMGLFMGALGRERTFIVHCKDDQLELPSDLAGVSLACFSKRKDGNTSAALGSVCTRLKQDMGIY
jgi:predicted nucleotide-binding protein